MAASQDSRDIPERMKMRAATKVATEIIASNLASVPDATRDSDETFLPVLIKNWLRATLKITATATITSMTVL